MDYSDISVRNIGLLLVCKDSRQRQHMWILFKNEVGKFVYLYAPSSPPHKYLLAPAQASYLQ